MLIEAYAGLVVASSRCQLYMDRVARLKKLERSSLHDLLITIDVPPSMCDAACLQIGHLIAKKVRANASTHSAWEWKLAIAKLQRVIVDLLLNHLYEVE